MSGDQRLADCLKRVSEAEQSLKKTREVLTALCKEAGGGQAAAKSSAPAAPAAAGQKADALGPFHDDLNLSSEEHDKCKEAFEKADLDKSGFISQTEMQKALQSITGQEVTAEYLQGVMAESDFDFDGKVSFKEFKRAFFMTKEQKDAERKKDMYEALKDSRDIHGLDAKQVVTHSGVKRKDVLRYLRKEINERGACLALPQALAIFVLFALAVTFHYDMEVLHGMDTSITFDIEENSNFAFGGAIPYDNGRMGHKGLSDVNSIADFWSWMNLGMTPLFFNSGWGLNEVRTNVATRCTSQKDNLVGFGWSPALAKDASSATRLGNVTDCGKVDDWSSLPAVEQDFWGMDGMDKRYLHYNVVVGGVRIRQERAATKDCPDSTLRKLYKGKCIDREAYWLLPELYQGLHTDEKLVDEPGGKTVYMLVGTDQATLRQMLHKLENSAWFGALTTKIEILFTTYNPQQGLVTATFVNLFINPGGHIYKKVEPVSVDLAPYDNGWTYVFDIAWLLLMMKLFIEETIELCKHWKQLGFVKGTMTYAQPVNCIDWLSIIYTFALIIYWSLHLVTLKKIRDLMEKGSVTVQGTWSVVQDRTDFYELVDQAVFETQTMKTLLAVFPFIIVSRFFKAFASQPRLGLVTNTVTRAAVDIIHFFVVFGTVFLVFALSAHILWGQELVDYANIGRTLNSTFRMLLGDYDWDELNKVGRPQAYLFFWSFTIGLAIIMMNMLVAIVLDVYTEVKGGISPNAETLWSQSYEILHGWREVRAGRQIPLSQVLDVLDPTSLEDEDDDQSGEQKLFRDQFCQEVEGLSKEQAFHILVASEELVLQDVRSGVSIADASLKIEKIDENVAKIQKILGSYVIEKTEGGPDPSTGVFTHADAEGLSI